MNKLTRWLRFESPFLETMSDDELLSVVRRQWTFWDLLGTVALMAIVVAVSPNAEGLILALVLGCINTQHRLGRRIDAVARLLDSRSTSTSALAAHALPRI